MTSVATPTALQASRRRPSLGQAVMKPSRLRWLIADCNRKALKDEVVAVEIGADRQVYHVHKALLVHHSKYFAKALQGPWTEAQSRTVTLEDIEAVIFNIFVHWLYYQQLPSGSDVDDWEAILEVPVAELSEHKILALMLKAYAFGDRFLSPTFRHVVNLTTEGLVSSTYFEPVNIAETVGWAFANIPSDRPILQLPVNEFCHNWAADDDTDSDDTDDDDDDEDDDDDDDFGDGDDLEVPNIVALRQMPALFMVRALLRTRELKDPSVASCHKNGCYLEHNSEEEKKACGKYHVRYNKEHDYGYLVKESGD